MEVAPIALQLYTVRDQTARDFAGTLRRVAEIGYPAVEFAGYGGLPSRQLARLLDDTGLQAAGTHLGLDALRHDLEGQIAYSREIGCSSLVLAGLPVEMRGAGMLPAVASELVEMGRVCRQAGLSLGYHNHDWELGELEGQTWLERLMAETDAQDLTFELDVYWAAHAGHDPVDFLRRHANKISILHMKDMDAEGRYTEVGEGRIDMSSLCAAGHAAGVRWYVLEHDAPRIPSLESAKVSLANLRSIQDGEEVARGR